MPTSLSIPLVKILTLLAVLAASVLFTGIVSAQTPCHLLTASDPVPAGFGAPFNAVSSARELVLRASCTNTGANISVGNGTNLQYIYKTGYEWKNNAWREISFQGGDLVGDAWYIGEARATLSRTATELAQNNFFVAYTCTWTGVQWRCGCRDSACAQSLWQIQAFKQTSPPPVAGGGAGVGRALDLKSQFPQLYDENLPYNGLFYGLAFNSDSFHPVRVGGNYPMISMRFRAERSGSITSVTYDNRINLSGQSGYSSGDGGRVHAEIRTDDGTERHWPTSTILGRTNTYTPVSLGNTMKKHDFQSPVQLEAGRLYHLVVVQGANNYVSINNPAISSRIDPLGGPYFGNDFFVLMYDGRTWRRASSDARRPKYLTTYASFCYTDGTCVGQGGWSISSNRFTLGGNNRARQTFTIAGPTRRTTGVWFRVARRSGVSAPLLLELKRGNTVVFNRSIPASQIDVGDIFDLSVTNRPVDWKYVEFPNVVPLQSGTSYSIELSSSASNAYQIKGHHDPHQTFSVVNDRNAWQNDRDGARGQVSTNGGSSWSNNINSGSIDFGFLFTLEGGPKSIQSVSGSAGILD